MSDPVFWVGTVILALATAALFGIRIALHLSVSDRLDPSIPASKRLPLAELRLKCNRDWLMRAASPTSRSLAARACRIAALDVADAKRDLAGGPGR